MDSPQPPSSWRNTLAAMVVAALAQVVLFFPPADMPEGAVPSPAGGFALLEPWRGEISPSPGTRYLLGDPILQMQPWLSFARESFAHGHPPVWNHLNGLGQPFWANPQARVFYPLHWPLFFTESMTWQWRLLILHLLILSWGVIFLLRTFGLGFWGLSLASVSATGFGLPVLWLFSPHMTTFVWLPWLLLGARWIMTGQGRRGASLLVLGSALLLLGGHPETAFKAVVALWLFIAGSWWSASCRTLRSWRTLILLLGSQFLGLLLAAPQILPFLDYLRESEGLAMRRGSPAYPALEGLDAFLVQAATWCSQVLTLRAHGHDLVPGRWWLDSINLREVGLIHGGLGAALLGIPGLLRRHPLRLPLILVTVFSLVVTLRVPGLYDLLLRVPGFDVGANQRFAALVALGLSLGAGLALDGLLRAPAAEARRLCWQIGVVALFFILVFAAETQLQGPAVPEQKKVLQETITWLLAAVVAVMVGVRCALSPSGKTIGALLLLVFLFVDMGLHGRPCIPWAAADAAWPVTPVIDVMQEDCPPEAGRILCVGESFPAEANLGYDLAFLDSYSAIQPREEALFLEAARVPVTPSGKKRIAWTLVDQFDRGLLDLASVRFLYVPGDWSGEAHGTNASVVEDQRGDRFRQLYRGVDGMVLERLNARPRLWLVAQTLKGQSWDVFQEGRMDSAQVAVVKDPRPLSMTKGSVTLRHYGEDGCRADVTVNGGAGLLCFSERWSKAWHVRVGGKTAPLIRVNGIFMGVELGEGQHHVEFQVKPGRPFFGGIALAALSALICLVVAFRWRRSTS